MVQFRSKNDKDKDNNLSALIDSSSKINVILPTYIIKLGLCGKKINAGVQKIDGSHLNIFEMVIADYLVKDQLGRV